jgi:hypothetical protein
LVGHGLVLFESCNIGGKRSEYEEKKRPYHYTVFASGFGSSLRKVTVQEMIEKDICRRQGSRGACHRFIWGIYTTI